MSCKFRAESEFISLLANHVIFNRQTIKNPRSFAKTLCSRIRRTVGQCDYLVHMRRTPAEAQSLRQIYAKNCERCP